MKKSLLGILGLALALYGQGCNSATDGVEIYQAVLLASNEVPSPKISSAVGTAGVTISGGQLSYSIEVNGGIKGITQAHIHTGGPTVSGPARVFLISFNAAGVTPGGDGVIKEGVTSATDFIAGYTFDQLAADIRNNNAYVNIHTTVNLGGEIRGQLVRVK